MFFFVPSIRSAILSVLNAIFATMIQAALAVSLKQVKCVLHPVAQHSWPQYVHASYGQGGRCVYVSVMHVCYHKIEVAALLRKLEMIA